MRRSLIALPTLISLICMLIVGAVLTLALAPPTAMMAHGHWRDITPFTWQHYTTSAYLWPAVPVAFYAAIMLSKHYLLTWYSKMLGTYLFAFGYFAISLGWIANALSVDAAQFGWLAPFSIFGIPALLSLPYALVGLLCWRTRSECYHWVFVHSWFLVEMVRSYVFPWNLLGDVSMASLYFAQFASIVGIYGMTALVLWLSGAIASNRPWQIMASILVFAVVFSFGGYRLAHRLEPQFHDVQMVIIQPSSPHHLGDKKLQQEAINTLSSLTAATPYMGKPQYIIWPEAAWPYTLQKWEDPHGGVIVQWPEITRLRLIPPHGKLIFGYDRISYAYNKVSNNFDLPILYNSIAVMNDYGGVLANYDKRILVPFGEYIPLRWLLSPIMEKIAYGQYDFEGGKTSNLLDLGELKGLPLICYEAIFSHYLRSFDLAKADFLLTITNDSWFGRGLGPYQHFAMARLRTIEYGMPMVRAANDGISAIITPYGEIAATVVRWKSTRVIGEIQKKLAGGTIYSSIGDYIVLLLILISVVRIIRSFRFVGKVGHG